MKRYFKHEAEDIGLGPGVAYFEFDGELPTRQVEHYGDRWLSSLECYHPGLGPGLVDMALSKMDFEPQHEIAQEEFEEAWNEALKQSP